MSDLSKIQQDVISDILETSPFGDFNDRMNMMVFGLLEESGEVAGIGKRLIRNNDRDVDAFKNHPHWLEEELGDVLWYLLGIIYLMNYDLDTIWDINRKKLEDRYGRSKNGSTM